MTFTSLAASFDVPAVGSTDVYRVVVSKDTPYVVELTVSNAKSGGGDNDETTEVDVKESNLDVKDVEAALANLGISLPAGMSVEKPSKADLTAAQERVTTKRTADAADEIGEKAIEAAEDLFDSGADVSKARAFLLPRMNFAKAGAYLLATDGPLTGVSLGEFLKALAQAVSGNLTPTIVVLTEAQLKAGDGLVLDEDGKVMETAETANPAVDILVCLEADTDYDPAVIAAPKTTGGPSSDNGSGGCDLGLGGVALLLAALLPLAKKR